MTLTILNVSIVVDKCQILHDLASERGDLKIRGFYTYRSCCRANRQRTFECVMLPEERYEAFTIASRLERFPGDVFVGNYSINLPYIDKVLVPYLKAVATDADVLILDEIGKMILASTSFRNWMKEMLAADMKPELIVSFPNRVQDGVIQTLRKRLADGSAEKLYVDWEGHEQFASKLYQQLRDKKESRLRRP